MTSVLPSSTRSIWRRKILRVSPASTSSLRCNPITPLMTAGGRKGVSVTRARDTDYAWRSFLNHRVTLAFGTDWPVAPLNPILALYAAVTRATLDGKNPDGWVPEEKITLPEALVAYTMGSAFAEFQEHVKGSITPGKLADMVILSDNIFDLKPEAIRNVKVATTIVGGKVVYTAP